MDPISLAVLGSLLAAFPMSFMAAKALPAAAVSAATPGLEGCRQGLRRQEAEAKKVKDAQDILRILTIPATPAEDEWCDEAYGGGIDWALVAATSAKAAGLPAPGPATAIRAEQCWPLGADMKALITVGEEQLLSSLLRVDPIKYGIALRRAMQRTETRGRALGLAP